MLYNAKNIFKILIPTLFIYQNYQYTIPDNNWNTFVQVCISKYYTWIFTTKLQSRSQVIKYRRDERYLKIILPLNVQY